ncbi:MAG: gliding motility-associated C-terminal domain-containing protein [Flavobacteriales bacterium]|nr:gliding motility-associated C-terminal domain-containing protein [Flavobacteriales bacterium]MCB9194362.1 gliding motility-associated C-terminal domain-containing protein [Flavobacteriales bacterium]
MGLVVALTGLAFSPNAFAQGTFPFSSGPIPQCDTSTFTANVSGVGQLDWPGSFWAYWLDNVALNITTDHPQTLQVLLTSPAGTTITLSAFNGAGGQNYTNTLFPFWGGPSITTGAAPFTGNWSPQNGSLSDFIGEWGSGTWTITLIDTACANGGLGPNGNWTPGWFDGGNGGSAIAFGFDPGPPPCMGWVNDGQGSICPGESFDILGYFMTNYPYNFVIYGMNYQPLAAPTTVTTPGSYYVEGTDPWDGCVYGANFTLSAGATVSLGADQAIDACPGVPVDLTAMYPLNGAAPAWSFYGSSITTAQAATATSPGSYRLIGTSSDGCTDTALVTLNVLAASALGPDQAASICQGQSTDLTTAFNITGLTAEWTLSGNAVADPTSADAAGNYLLVATNTDGCTDTAQVALAVTPNPALGPDMALNTCSGTSVDLTGLYATGVYTSNWTQNGTAVNDPTAVNNSGDYELVVADMMNCTDTAVVSLTLDPVPTLGPDQQAAICSGAAFDLSNTFITSGLTTTWTHGGSIVADPTDVALPGAYQLEATNNFGCADTAVLALTVHANPSLGGDRSFSICPWQSVDLGTVFHVAGMTAAYTFAGVPVNDPTTAVDSGLYVISVVDANGCVDTATAFVSPIECLCEADFTEDAHCLQDPVQFTLVADSAIVGAHWDFGDAATNSSAIDPRVAFISTNDEHVLVTLEAELTCGTVTVEHLVHMPDCTDSCSVYIPSAFTPDADHVNDLWSWVGECRPEDFSMMIFDRWGELVFKTEDPDEPWDGTCNGTQVQDGVYVYRAGYRLPYQDRKEVTGAVVVVR